VRHNSDKDAVTYVFILILWQGIGTDRQIIAEVEFASLSSCLIAAQMIVKRFGYETPRDRALAYCVPKRVSPEA
jgi:hypothetical protein